jgi:uncharacterized protein (TIGR02217 family)
MADFSLSPDYALETSKEYKTLVSKFENGYEQRRQKWASVLREWKLVYKNRDATDLSTITTVFDNKKGAFTSFTWTNPLDSTDYTVRFKEDSLKYTCPYYGRYNIEFSLCEVK